MILPRNVTVTVGGASFKTKMDHEYSRSQPILKVGMIYLTNHATVHVLHEALYGVTHEDGEYLQVYRARDGRLIGHPYAVSEVINAEVHEWTTIKCGVRR